MHYSCGVRKHATDLNTKVSDAVTEHTANIKGKEQQCRVVLRAEGGSTHSATNVSSSGRTWHPRWKASLAMVNAYHLQAGQDGVGWPGGGRHPRGRLVTRGRGMHFQKR